MKTIYTILTIALLCIANAAQAQLSVCDSSGYSLSLSVNSVSCPKGATGVATVASTGCTCMFSGCIFTWSNGQNGHTISGLQAGTYNVTVAHPNGCVLDTFVVITEPPAFVESISKEDPSCHSLSNGIASVVSASNSGILSYQWSTGDTLASISNISAGKYFVTTTNIINCNLVDSIELIEPPALNASTSTSASCANGTTGDITMTISGGTPPYSCIWSNGTTTQNLNDVAAGTYSVIASDANGCTKNQDATVASLPSPQPNIISPNTVICAGTSTQLIATLAGGGTYTWSPTIGLSNPNINAPIASPSQTTTYTVTTTAPNGCIGTAQITVTVNVCTDIDLITPQTNWAIAPNPFSDLLTIATTITKPQDVHVRLYNTLGQVVYTQLYAQQNGLFNTQINLAHLPEGIYILEAQANEDLYRRQIIKVQ